MNYDHTLPYKQVQINIYFSNTKGLVAMTPEGI